MMSTGQTWVWIASAFFTPKQVDTDGLGCGMGWVGWSAASRDIHGAPVAIP